MKSFVTKVIPFILASGFGVLIAVFINTLYHPVIVSGNSMYPTYESDEILEGIPIKDESQLYNGCVVTFKKGYKELIKRIVGMPGDTLLVKEGTLYIKEKGSNEFVKSLYNYEQIEDPGVLKDEFVISDNCYFCMGDNRNFSRDCRVIGEVSYSQLDKVVGKLLIKLK